MKPGFDFLYRIKPHEWVELSNGKVVEVWSQEGVDAYIRGTGDDISLRRVNALQMVKPIDNSYGWNFPIESHNKKKLSKETKNGALPKLQRNTKRS